MSGHSHWAGIKHKKEIADQKRGKVFSKLLSAISVAAKPEPNPDFNPRLRTAVEKAKGAGVPSDNIERAVKRALESGQNLEELTFEAYGPGGVAILIEAVSDNRNRAVAEIKKILSDSGGKWAEAGSVRWAFDKIADTRRPDADSRGQEMDQRELDPSTDRLGAGTDQRGNWQPKFPQELSTEDNAKLEALIAAIEEHEDVQRVYTNAKS